MTPEMDGASREACKASVKMFNVPDQTIPRPKSQVHQPEPGPNRWRSESEGDKGGDRKKTWFLFRLKWEVLYLDVPGT